MKTTKTIVTLDDQGKGVKIRNGGGRYVFSIPKALVDNGVLAGDKRYEIVVNEICGLGVFNTRALALA